ncbi:MAG: S8 family serine peptidase, partial [Tepidisphaeraceae bacterium]
MAVQRSGRHGQWCALVCVCAVILGALVWPAKAIVSSNTYLPIQQVVGAERFYNEGYYGFGVVIANVEAGHVWDQHEVFTTPAGPGVYQVQDPSLDAIFSQTQYDPHATAVGSILTGLGPYQPGIGYYYYQFGMAPGAALISSAIATGWVGNTGEFNISTQSFNSGYLIPMRDGVPIEVFGKGTGLFITQRADVVNSSWGFDDPTGTAQESMTIDALIVSYRQTVCLAAGNHDTGTAQVIGPASGYNGIAVGALASDQDNPPYRTVATFSNVGPNDFHNPKLNLDIPAVRAAVDITAPGQDIIAAAYTGSTGSNTGLTDPYPGQNDLYYIGIAGTSFASPTVAGGAALMVGAARDRLGSATKATDTLIVKAILMNSADKLPGWTNNTTSVGGVLVTTQGLDYSSGAGAMNLDRAFDQEFAGNTDLPGPGGGP